MSKTVEIIDFITMLRNLGIICADEGDKVMTRISIGNTVVVTIRFIGERRFEKAEAAMMIFSKEVGEGKYNVTQTESLDNDTVNFIDFKIRIKYDE